MKHGGHVYILTNKNNTVLYTGVTSNLRQRLWQHQHGIHEKAFTKQYNVTKLVYYKEFDRIETAILREKQIKGGSRQKKLELINRFNPEWKDLTGQFL
jgi:putative endonuclease